MTSTTTDLAYRAVAELERLVTWRQYQRQVIPEWSRPLTPTEVRSRCNFAALDRIMREGYSSTAASLRELRDAILQDMAEAVVGSGGARDVAARVAAWAVRQSPAVQQAVADATDAVHASLVGVADRAGRQVLREAAAQGVRITAEQARVDPNMLMDAARLPSAAVQNRIVSAVLAAGQRPSTAEGPVKAAENTSIMGAEDLARQGVNIANGEGRGAVLGDLPAAVSYTASELLDGNTCDPCSDVDGTFYASLEEAEVDYPSGPYVDCDGGSRCRGTLVAIWEESAAGTDPISP